MSQKSNPAPIERKQKMAMGEMRCPPIKSLHTMMFIPKMEYAMKQARWPRSFEFMMSCKYYLDADDTDYADKLCSRNTSYIK